MPSQPSSSARGATTTGTTSGDPETERLSRTGDPPGTILVSFDIDGTLEDGDPPGPLPMALAEKALALGYLVGSASDRTLGEQTRMWERRGIAVHFVSHKHTLDQVAARFPAVRRVHLGDTDVDAHYACAAGFEFFHADKVPRPGTPGWIF